MSFETGAKNRRRRLAVQATVIGSSILTGSVGAFWAADSSKKIDSHSQGAPLALIVAQPEKVRCTINSSNHWKGIPPLSDSNEIALAQMMGVSKDRIKTGSFGDAECKPQVSDALILARLVTASVTGVSDNCLVLDRVSSPSLTKNVKSDSHLLTACAGPELSISSVGV